MLLEVRMPDKQMRNVNEILGLLILAAVFAAMTYPLFQLTGIHDLLVQL